jgi:LuxR family maltose regulon positive regulatory protein
LWLTLAAIYWLTLAAITWLTLTRDPTVRRFLLQTAILDRLNGPLCDAVTQQQESKARLGSLERGNFFVVPLDNKRHWYRYHQLFADVLYAHLMAEQPDQVPILHRRASEWFEHNGSADNAIRHALAARDFARAATLIELAIPTMRQSRQEATVLRWLQMLPDDLFHFRPVLNVHYAGVLLQNGKIEGVEARLYDADRWLDVSRDMGEPSAFSSAEMVVVDEEEFRGLAGSIAMYRAAMSLAVGNVTDTMKYARRVLDLVPVDDDRRRAAAAGFLGLAYWTSGDLEAAYQSHADCMATLQRIGFISDAIGCAIALADIRIAQGHLHDAMRIYENALQLATVHDTPALRGTADMYVGMSLIERERGNLNAATQHLLRSKELGEFAGLPQNQYRWRVAMARICETEGDLDGAINLLQEAERLYVGDFSPNVRPVAASKARVQVVWGRLGEAFGWVRGQDLSVADDLSYLHEFEYITLVRVLLARYQNDHADRFVLEAISLLERLLHAAEQGDRLGSIIEILVLLAVAHQLQGDITAALEPLTRALTLAEPEGYVRIFVDEGAPMAFLLEKVAKHGIALNYVRQLLIAFGKTVDKLPVSQTLSDPLSERELEVLRLLGTDLSGPEIARELVVSLNTVRTHTKNIYTKLGVNGRQAAVRRAEELDLF